MAKTIKFNLRLNNNQIRNIEDLQNNFSIEDMLSYYENGLLHRWLNVHGYIDELNGVKKINSVTPKEIITKLIKIFNIDDNIENLEESLYILNFQSDQKKQLIETEKRNHNFKELLEDYRKNYEKLIKEILDHPADMPLIKACISQILNEYKWIFELNHREIFFSFLDKSTYAVMALLMNKDSRNYFLPIKVGEKLDSRVKVLEDEMFKLLDTIKKFPGHYTEYENKRRIAQIHDALATYKNKYQIILDIDTNSDKKQMFCQICELVYNKDFKTILADSLKRKAGKTDGKWIKIEPKKNKYMIISLDYGANIRPTGQDNIILSSDDIFEKFLIIDGIDFKSDSSAGSVLYMEV